MLDIQAKACYHLRQWRLRAMKGLLRSSLLFLVASASCVLLALSVRETLVADSARSAQELQPWSAQQSWAGNALHDARLDRTVTFWGAGIPLAQVFAGVRAQTGVEIGVSPEGSDAARLCVNLFVNPQDPLTVRELLVQLAWALDASFSCDFGAEPPRYYLVHRSPLTDVSTHLQASAHARSGQEEADRLAREKELRARAFAKLPEAVAALGLSRDAALARYRGQDVFLLAALLDPGRRSTLTLLGTLSPEQIEFFRRERYVEIPWAQLTGEQRALIDASVRPWAKRKEWEEARRGDSGSPESRWEALKAVGPRSLHLVFDSCRITPLVWVELTGKDAGSLVNVCLTPLVLDAGSGEEAVLQVSAQVDIRRALGETVSFEEQGTLVQNYWDQANRRDRRRSMENQLAQQCRLSEETEQLLASLHVPVQAHPASAYALWQVQESVAAASGLSVISDCAWQPPLGTGERADALPPADRDSLTALEALRLATVSLYAVPVGANGALRGDPGDADNLSWEWGNAGRILRFRSAQREVWRAAFLPERSLATLAEWIDPALPDFSENREKWPDETVPLDVWKLSALITSLDATQLQWGGYLVYGDPADPKTAYRRDFAAAVLHDSAPRAHVYRMLSRLNADQRQRLLSEGLVWGVDIPQDAWAGEPPARGELVRLGEKMPFSAMFSSSLPGLGGSHLWLTVQGQGERESYYALPREAQVHPQIATYLPRPAGEGHRETKR
jgi:hypothetical protein